MARLFQRECVVTVGDLRMQGLRVAFKVEKSTKEEPNTCDVTITNLSAEHRQRVQRKGQTVSLLAGHVGSSALIFVGEVLQANHQRDGADWNTQLRGATGAKAMRTGWVSESFAAGTPLLDVMLRVSGALGVDPGNSREVLSAEQARMKRQQVLTGYAAFGSAARELSGLLKPHGMSWSIQDGRLQVLAGTSPASGAAVRLTPSTGLVGSPEFGTPDFYGVKEPPRLKVRSLLLPALFPGCRVQLESERYTGDLRAEKVTHSGDTHGGDWYTEIEGIPL